MYKLKNIGSPIINHSNFIHHHGDGEYFMSGEVNTKPSLTVPNMVPPLQTLIDRFVRGEQITIQPPVYLGSSETVPDRLERMDFAERRELADSLKAIKRPPAETPEPEPEPAPAESEKPV